MNAGIYGIFNRVNRKWYIGQSVEMNVRLNMHRWRLKRGEHQNDHLQKSFLKHGEAAFEFRVVEIVPEAELDARERFWIQHHKSTDPKCGYNRDSGGNLAKRHSDQTCVKISAALKGRASPLRGRPQSAEARASVSAALTGRVRSAEERLQISLSKKGKQPSPKQYAHILEMVRIQKLRPDPKIGRKLSDEHRQKMREGHARRRARLEATAA